MSPDLSIVIPSYNDAGYLASCIGSLSSAVPSVEIIVVDDGSTDDTQEVLAALSERRPDIRVIKQENRGVASARNAGIRESSGKYLMFVDADDRLFPGSLDLVARNIQACDSDIIVFKMFCEGREEYPWEGFFGQRHRYTAMDLMNKNYIRGSVCGCLFRLDYLKKNDIRFSDGLSLAEDTVFFACAISSGAGIEFSDIRLYDVILSEGSASRRRDATFLDRYGKALAVGRSVIKDRAVADNTLFSILMGVVNVAAESGYSAKDAYRICGVESVLPLSVADIARHKWLVMVLNHSFALFFAIKKWRDRLLPHR